MFTLIPHSWLRRNIIHCPSKVRNVICNQTLNKRNGEIQDQDTVAKTRKIFLHQLNPWLKNYPRIIGGDILGDLLHRWNSFDTLNWEWNSRELLSTDGKLFNSVKVFILSNTFLADIFLSTRKYFWEIRLKTCHRKKKYGKIKIEIIINPRFERKIRFYVADFSRNRFETFDR